MSNTFENNISTEMQSLMLMLRRISAGELKIPAFQRSFVWSENQVISLLESIYMGYPIGSILLWSTTEDIDIRKSLWSLLPGAKKLRRTTYVLDGVQRLTTLYAIFYNEDTQSGSKFDIAFDLDGELFVKYHKNMAPEAHIRLSDLFDTKKFVNTQQRLLQSPQGSEYAAKAIDLFSHFQQYSIPTITISGQNLEDVVKIFERINNTGTKLNAIDIARATVWSTKARLNEEIAQLQESLRATGYELEDDLIIKCIALFTGNTADVQGISALRNVKDHQLTLAVQQTGNVIYSVIDFLQSRLQIPAIEMLPYEMQFFGLVKVFSTANKYLGSEPTAISIFAEKWFWCTAFGERIKNIKDGKSQAIFMEIERDLSITPHNFQCQMKLTPEEILKRNFVPSSPFGLAFRALFAKNDARSLITGNIIEFEHFTSKDRRNSFDWIDNASTERGNRKSVANAIITTKEDRIAMGNNSLVEVIQGIYSRFGRDADSILLSQFILPRTVHLLNDQHIQSFWAERARLFHQSIINLVK